MLTATEQSRHYTLLAGGEVEIIPGPEVGLSWVGCAPCLLRQVEGDFLFETRISTDSHPQRAGGIVVWQRPERFIRFASGVDHLGQITLARNEGKAFRFAGVGFLTEGEVHLRLVRTGTHYEGFVSPDGGKWYACGNLEFGEVGPVEVGLFAECNYEYGFPQPFPIRFADTSLWIENNFCLGSLDKRGSRSKQDPACRNRVAGVLFKVPFSGRSIAQ